MSFRNHRILVAALFLPHTAILGPDPAEEYEEYGLSTGGYTTAEDDGSVTPVELGATPGPSLLEVTEKLHHEKKKSLPVTVPSLITSATPPATPGPAGPPLSIVEDLKDRAASRPGLVKQTTNILGGQVSTTGNRSPTHEPTAHPFLTPGGALSGTKSMEGPTKRFALNLPVKPSPLQHATISPSSPPSSSRSSNVAQAAALKRTLSRQRSRNISSKRSSRSSSRATSTARPSSTSLTSSVASLDSLESLSSRLDEEVEEGEEEFHIAHNPHVNGGLKNAIESVSAAMMHGSGFAASAPPTKSSFSFVPGHSRSTSLANSIHGNNPSMEFSRLWIGCLGTKTDDWSARLRERVEEALPQQEGGAEVPVWVEDSVFEGCYDEFCHQVKPGSYPRLYLIFIRESSFNSFYGQHYTTPSPMPPKHVYSTNRRHISSMLA